MKKQLNRLILCFVSFSFVIISAQAQPVTLPPLEQTLPVPRPSPTPMTGFGDAAWSGELKDAYNALNSFDLTGFKNLLASKPQLAKAVNANGETLLHAAAANGFKTEAARILLEAGADANAADKKGVTPLHAAASYGNKDGFMLLLARKPNLRLKTGDGSNLLHLAAGGGDAEIGRALLTTKEFDLNGKNTAGDTPLIIAAGRYFGNNLLKLLLDAGANPNLANATGVTPLHRAATVENVESVELMLAKKADARARDEDGDTPLHNAYGEAKIIAALVAAGADVNARSKNGDTPLHRAALHTELVAVRALAANRADVNAVNAAGETALQVTLASGSFKTGDATEIVKILIDNKADTTLRDAEGRSLIHRAALSENAEFVELLAERKINLEAKTNDGSTPLMLAVIEGYADTVDALLEAGANPNAADEDGDAPLHVSAGKNLHVITRLLLAKKADVNLTNEAGQTPLHRAAANNNARLAALLLQSGASVNQPDEEGNTPLHIAAKEGGANVARILLANKADAALKNKADQTARQLAEANSLADVAALLPETPAEN